MDYVTMVGSIAAVCTTVSYLPQVFKAYRTKRTQDLSLPMYVILLIGVAMWMYYGILVDSLPIITANAITLILCLYIISMKITHK